MSTASTTPRASPVAGASAPPAAARRRRSSWRAPVALLALSFVPVVGGVGRLVEVLGGPEVLPADARFADSPVPLVLHIVAAVAYAVVGAFQFSAGVRRHWPAWHRRTGRLLVVAGLVVAHSGFWMTLVYPFKEGAGEILWAARLLVSAGMTVSLLLGFTAVRRRDLRRHRAWMTRAYALALGAGTQVLTISTGHALIGGGVMRTDVLTAIAWPISLAVAAIIIRRPRTARAATRPPSLRGAA